MTGIRGFLAVGLVVASVGVVAAADTPDPREKLDTAIPEGIRLLEAKEYVAFVKSFVRPDEMKTILETEKATLEEFAARFGKKKAPTLLAMLKVAKDTTPTLDAKGETATYVFKQEVDGKKKIAFFKVDKLWYIKNKD